MTARLLALVLAVGCGDEPTGKPRPDPTTPGTTETTAPCDRPEDADGDGVADPCDLCPGADDHEDTDGDGVADACDACPEDAPDDTDYDGVCDGRDACPGHDDRTDADADGFPDGCDICDGQDDAELPEPTACEGLDEPTCQATTGCWPLHGVPGPAPWTATEAYAGCMTSAGAPACGDALTVASPRCETGACWFFTSTCVPDGWLGDATCPVP